jgi:hypothetical protein
VPSPCFDSLTKGVFILAWPLQHALSVIFLFARTHVTVTHPRYLSKWRDTLTAPHHKVCWCAPEYVAVNVSSSSSCSWLPGDHVANTAVHFPAAFASECICLSGKAASSLARGARKLAAEQDADGTRACAAFNCSCQGISDMYGTYV